VTTTYPFVSAVIPCRNEAKFLRPCLDSLLANDYPVDRFEVLVIDGDSDDGTALIAGEFAGSRANVRVLHNPARAIPVAMNLGIREARGDVILKIDAHADYDADYISACVRRMQEYDADCVGGVLETKPAKPGLVGRAVAAVLSHGFGSGNAAFRTGVPSPRWADTAAFGCYKRSVFDKIGMYDERLIRSSDMDLNTRLRKSGGRILLAPDIRARYYCRTELPDFFRRNLLDGFWALYPIRFGSRLMKFRHLLPLICLIAGVLMLVAGVFWPPLLIAILGLAGLYIVMALAAGTQLAWQARELRFVALVPFIFALRHSGYALGASWGAVKGLVGRSLA
jgi:succinoglycan biosynthesis protein ExoA